MAANYLLHRSHPYAHESRFWPWTEAGLFHPHSNLCPRYPIAYPRSSMTYRRSIDCLNKYIPQSRLQISNDGRTQSGGGGLWVTIWELPPLPRKATWNSGSQCLYMFMGGWSREYMYQNYLYSHRHVLRIGLGKPANYLIDSLYSSLLRFRISSNMASIIVLTCKDLWVFIV